MSNLTGFEVALLIGSAISFVRGFVWFINELYLKKL